jgi:hypothetical protein
MVFQRSGAHSTVVCDSAFRTLGTGSRLRPRLRRGRARVLSRVVVGACAKLRVVGRSLRDRRVALG